MITANPTPATAIPNNNLNAIGRCQLCGSTRLTARVKFERNIGMLVLRQTRRAASQPLLRPARANNIGTSSSKTFCSARGA